MEIKILEVYPVAMNELEGTFFCTLKIAVPSLGMDILGITAHKFKNRWKFELPYRVGYHHELKQRLQYPIINWIDKEIPKALLKFLDENAPDYIMSRINDKDKPLPFPPAPPKKLLPKKREFTAKPAYQKKHWPQVCKKPPQKPLPKPSFQALPKEEWVDICPRPQARNSSKFNR